MTGEVGLLKANKPRMKKRAKEVDDILNMRNNAR